MLQPRNWHNLLRCCMANTAVEAVVEVVIVAVVGTTNTAKDAIVAVVGTTNAVEVAIVAAVGTTNAVAVVVVAIKKNYLLFALCEIVLGIFFG